MGSDMFIIMSVPGIFALAKILKQFEFTSNRA
jgi:hypothetical protein